MPKFCLNRIRPLVRVRSPPTQSKNEDNSTTSGDERKTEEFSGVEKGMSGEGVDKSRAIGGRKVMVVVDSSMEAKNALQWALSHTLQNHDILVLLHVIRPSKQGDQSTMDTKVPEFINTMKTSCQVKRPEVVVEVAVVEGKDRGAAIVEAAGREGAALLVVGQKKRSVTWRLMLMWTGAGRGSAGGVAEYCVQNAGCMAIAVRRKSKKLGGYLITTKRQKDFWLLA
ncbi:Adenine nucleotide alpha hydrolases-like superfamily protein [Striga hermonthica]|uniref:Adenine nucleotide alpha hydrolases-like superfamily protein n=1 Tax=Striga hermonthica TaxID=68872 RepID=A0A9N7NLA7_STRHE|nr:Adenine nucleotide alpha hydrolases-like superfamily protein [Striga hermonthica]